MSGDTDDFDAFYAGSVRRVTGYLYAVTGSRAEAEDAAQEAFARAWQHWPRVSGYADPEAWVRRVPDRDYHLAQDGEPDGGAPPARGPRR
jgi:RNA polymerase sigma-70 factor (ECF subfamily)